MEHVGAVYKGWHVERKLHSSRKVWDNKKDPKQNMIELKKHPQAKRWNGFSLGKSEESWPTLSTSIVQPILKSMIQSIVLKLIKPRCGRFIITREWSKQFMKQMLDLLCDNHSTSKFPPYWLAQSCTMVYRVVYLMKNTTFRLHLLCKMIILDSILCLKVVRKLESQKELNMCKWTLSLDIRSKSQWWYPLVLQGPYFHHRLWLLALHIKHFHQRIKGK